MNKRILKTTLVIAVLGVFSSAQAWEAHTHTPVIHGSISGHGTGVASAGGSGGVVTNTESMGFTAGTLSLANPGILTPLGTVKYDALSGYDTLAHGKTTNVSGPSNSWASTVGHGGFSIVLPNMGHHHE